MNKLSGGSNLPILILMLLQIVTQVVGFVLAHAVWQAVEPVATLLVSEVLRQLIS